LLGPACCRAAARAALTLPKAVEAVMPAPKASADDFKKLRLVVGDDTFPSWNSYKN
jgi:hypothetical protein